jgi:hypothetical protein
MGRYLERGVPLSLVHRSRLLLQPYVPGPVLGLGAWAKLAYKTKVFIRPQELRRRWAVQLHATRGKPLSLDEFEYGLLSQNGEDGILETIFQVIGFSTRSVLEFGFAATEASLLNLALAHDLGAYFMDGSDHTCRLATALFRVMGRRRLRVAQAFITAENINDVIAEIGLRGEIDALSIDVDGNDYWLWQALEVVNPRLVVAEYNDRLGPRAAVTIAYDPSFVFTRSPHEFYQGASLAALAKLADRRGYRLIGCESSGTNAFFLRTDIDAPSLPTHTVADAFRYHVRSGAGGQAEAEQEVIIASLPFVHV